MQHLDAQAGSSWCSSANRSSAQASALRNQGNEEKAPGGAAAACGRPLPPSATVLDCAASGGPEQDGCHQSAARPPSLPCSQLAAQPRRRPQASCRPREAERAGHDPPERHGDDALNGALALLDDVPARQRAALTLRYVHDLPDATIARALRCRPGTVRSLLSRGREAVRAAIEHDHRSPHEDL